MHMTFEQFNRIVTEGTNACVSITEKNLEKYSDINSNNLSNLFASLSISIIVNLAKSFTIPAKEMPRIMANASFLITTGLYDNLCKKEVSKLITKTNVNRNDI